MILWELKIDNETDIHADSFTANDYTLCGIGWEDATICKKINGTKKDITCPFCLKIIAGVMKG